MTNFKIPFNLNNQIKNPKLIWLALLTGVVGYWAQPAFAEALYKSGSTKLDISATTTHPQDGTSELALNAVIQSLPSTHP